MLLVFCHLSAAAEAVTARSAKPAVKAPIGKSIKDVIDHLRASGQAEAVCNSTNHERLLTTGMRQSYARISCTSCCYTAADACLQPARASRCMLMTIDSTALQKPNSGGTVHPSATPSDGAAQIPAAKASHGLFWRCREPAHAACSRLPSARRWAWTCRKVAPCWRR